MALVRHIVKWLLNFAPIQKIIILKMAASFCL